MNIFILAGQFIVGLVFIASVVYDFLDRNTLLSLLDSKLESLLKRKIPNTKYLFYGGMGLKVICGLALIFNLLAHLAAFLLAGFVIIANVVFNNFWAQQGDVRKASIQMFLVYWAITGGLIVLIGA